MEVGGLQFCLVGPPALISMLPLGPKPPPASPSSSPLFASNREGLCAVGRKAVSDTSTSMLRNWVGRGRRHMHKHRGGEEMAIH